jgi:hypothetical protein
MRIEVREVRVTASQDLYGEYWHDIRKQAEPKRSHATPRDSLAPRPPGWFIRSLTYIDSKERHDA